MRNILLIIISSLFLYSCAGIYSQSPKPVTSEHFITYGGGFTMKLDKSRRLFYGINIISKNQLSPSNFVVVTYQNPSSKIPFKQESLVSELTTSNLVENATTYIFKSPLVKGVKQHTNYKINIKLYKNSSKKELIATHEQLVNSSYTKN